MSPKCKHMGNTTKNKIKKDTGDLKSNESFRVTALHLVNTKSTKQRKTSNINETYTN